MRLFEAPRDHPEDINFNRRLLAFICLRVAAAWFLILFLVDMFVGIEVQKLALYIGMPGVLLGLPVVGYLFPKGGHK